MTAKKNEDKKGLFLGCWTLYAPGRPAPVGEYRFMAHAFDLLDDTGQAKPGFRDELRKVGGGDWRFDWAWPNLLVAVEVDGGGWVAHGGRHASDRDRQKLNWAVVLGWSVFRFSPRMLADPAFCVAQVRLIVDATLEAIREDAHE